MEGFILFCTIFTVITNLILIVLRNFKWSTINFKIIGYICITVLVITFYFVEEFTVSHSDFYKFIGFALSPLVVLLMDLILKNISIRKYGRDFYFTTQNNSEAYFGDVYEYTILDKVFSIVLLIVGVVFPIVMMS